MAEQPESGSRMAAGLRPTDSSDPETHDDPFDEAQAPHPPPLGPDEIPEITSASDVPHGAEISAQPSPAEAEKVDAEAPESPASFADLPIKPVLLEAVRQQGWLKPTEVQAKSFIPISEGRDVLVESHTGSGKTGAFCLPWLASRFEAGDPRETGVQLLVLTPTRELAKQVCDELARLALESPVRTLAIYGGTAMRPQFDRLREGLHAVVGTPGRILDHIRRRSLDLSRVRLVVLDEADEMLSMGFLEDIRSILEACPEKRQTALFSATIPPEIERISKRYMQSPVAIRLSGDRASAAEIGHAFYSVSGSLKTRDLLDVIEIEEPTTAIVFCNTREETNFVASALQREGLAAEQISSDLTQTAREGVMQRMRDGKIRFLVATDVAARGIDVSHVSHVINYTFPENAESYIHRTGRTGRAGRPGSAISLIGPQELGSFYELKLIYPSIQFSERMLPPPDVLAAQRMGSRLDRVSHQFTELVSPEWTLLARSLAVDPRGERVFALLLQRALTPPRTRDVPRDHADDDDSEDQFARRRGRGRGRHRRGDSESAWRPEARRTEAPRPTAEPVVAREVTPVVAREESDPEETSRVPTEDAPPVHDRGDEQTVPFDRNKKRRRRRRRRGRSGSRHDGDNGLESEVTIRPSAAESGHETEDEPLQTNDSDDHADQDTERQAHADGAAESAPEPRRGRRRRRRRRGGGTSPNPDPGPAPGAPEAAKTQKQYQAAAQDEIVLDIDESELDIVRDAFGEIDELDELTLKARRRAVIDVLRDEVELEDLSDRDHEAGDEAEGEEADSSDALDVGIEVGGGVSNPAEDETTFDETVDADDDADAPRKRKRRRRRRKKKVEPETPELMVAPHKDFWEAWASRFSYDEFEDEPYYSRFGTPDTQNEVTERQSETAPAVADVPAAEFTGELVRVKLNIGRSQGKKAAHVRELLEEKLGLSGRDIRDLTVRDNSTAFRVDGGQTDRIQSVLAGLELDGVILEVGLMESKKDSDDSTTVESEHNHGSDAETKSPDDVTGDDPVGSEVDALP